MTGSAPRHIVGIGASAGGVDAFLAVLGGLPADLDAALFLVIHRHPTAESRLAELLGRRTRLVVREPEDGEEVRRGFAYLAPRDHHMTVRADRLRLDRHPKQHRSRPAIDPIFESLAAYRSRTTGVLLTGALSDGVKGLIAIKTAGGTTIAQDPAEAVVPCLPRNAIAADDVDRILRLAEIARFIVDVGETPQ